MKINKFDELDLHQRSDYVIDNGEYICMREHKKYLIGLYSLDSFFVEVFYKDSDINIEQVLVVTEDYVLNEYLSFIDINTLIVDTKDKNSFEALTVTDRSEYLLRHGIFIENRYENDYLVSLYFVNNFYAEMQFEKQSITTKKVEIISYEDALKYYFSETDISFLID